MSVYNSFNFISDSGGLEAFQKAAESSEGLAKASAIASVLPFLPRFSRVRMLSDARKFEFPIIVTIYHENGQVYH